MLCYSNGTDKNTACSQLLQNQNTDWMFFRSRDSSVLWKLSQLGFLHTLVFWVCDCCNGAVCLELVGGKAGRRSRREMQNLDPVVTSAPRTSKRLKDKKDRTSLATVSPDAVDGKKKHASSIRKQPGRSRLRSICCTSCFFDYQPCSEGGIVFSNACLCVCLSVCLSTRYLLNP